MAYLDPNIPLRVPQQPSFGEQMGEAFKMADVVEKQRAMQQQRQDSANLQQYLKEGGNLDTPEGIAKATEWGKQNLSASGYQTIVGAGQEMRTNEQKRIEALSKAEGAQLDNMLKRSEVIGQSVAPALTKYTERKAAVGEQQAGEEFKASLQPVLQNLVQQKIITPQQAQQYADASPAQVESVLQSTNYGRKMVLEAAKLKQIQAGTEADISLKAERDARTEAIKKGKPAAAAGGIGEPPLTDDILESGIAKYRAGLPRTEIVVGRSKEAQRKWELISQGAIDQIMAENPGMTRGQAAKELSMGQAGYSGNVAALKNVMKDISAIKPFEGMLNDNAEIAINLGKKTIASNARLGNIPLNQLRKYAGDYPDLSEFLAQTIIVQTEAARVLNNPRLVGQLTDNARQEMKEVISGDMPLKSFTRVLRRVQDDGRRRVKKMENQRDELLGKAEKTAEQEKPTPVPMAAAPAAKTAVPKGIPASSRQIGKTPDGKIVWQSPDGKKWVE